MDKIPLGAAFNKAWNFRIGLMFGQKDIPEFLERVLKDEIAPSRVFTHHLRLE